MNLTPLFESAVMELNRRQSAPLGDRRAYIGSSDIAGCPRKAFLQRQHPKTPSVSTLLKFARGHAAEDLVNGILQASDARHIYDQQVEIVHPEVPLRCHIDFLFYADLDGAPGLHVIEVKSVSGIPDAPYPQWEDQLLYQLGMLRIQYPHGKITGSILAVDLNAGQMHQFVGYQYDETMFNYLYHRGLHLLDALNGEVEACPSPSHLCAYCPYRGDCPAMALPKVELPPEIDMLALKYAELNGCKSRAEKEMKSIRQELVDFTGPSFKGCSDECELIVTSVEPSQTVDGALLKSNFPDIYHEVLKPRAGYTRLEVKRIRSTEPLKEAA